MSYLSAIPEDVSRLVWRKVFDGVIADIKGDSVYQFYDRFYNKYHIEDVQKYDKILRLRKTRGTCKNIRLNKNRTIKYINEVTDLIVRQHNLRKWLIVILERDNPDFISKDYKPCYSGECFGDRPYIYKIHHTEFMR